MTSANGKKRPVRVFLDDARYSRLLIQAGTHTLTPSTLGELIMEDGLDRLERGDLSPLGLADSSDQRPGSGA